MVNTSPRTDVGSEIRIPHEKYAGSLSSEGWKAVTHASFAAQGWKRTAYRHSAKGSVLTAYACLMAIGGKWLIAFGVIDNMGSPVTGDDSRRARVRDKHCDSPRKWN